MKHLVFLSCLLYSQLSFGWGEVGHHLIARVAAQLAARHPLLEPLRKTKPEALASFLKTMAGSKVVLGHLANIPDTYWRNLDGGLKEEGDLLGSPSHYLDADEVLDIPSPLQFFKNKLPLEYEAAKELGTKKKKPFYVVAGSVPWRAEQFASLLLWSLQNYPKSCAADSTATTPVVGFAGLMTHFTGDAGQPLHSTLDYDGQSTGQKGIHWYYENDTVNVYPEGDLEREVTDRGLKLLLGGPQMEGSVNALRAKAFEIYGEKMKTHEVTAMMVALLGNSFLSKAGVVDLDREYAIKKDGTRNPPSSVAEYFRSNITYRLAVSAAFTADIWVRQWLKAESPVLCEIGRLYPLKPAFISPTDKNCYGYAVKEKAADFFKRDKKSALESWKGADNTDGCFKLN